VDTDLNEDSFGLMTWAWKVSDAETELNEKGYSEKFHLTCVVIVSELLTLTLHWYSSLGEVLAKVFSKNILNETKSKLDFPKEILLTLSVPKRFEKSLTLRTSLAEFI
jgi:hypothetical protein